jgi:putative hydrolase of the HAD superfamily
VPVLFDLDDTLLDDVGAQDVYLPALHAAWGDRMPHDEPAFRRAWAEALDRHFPRYLSGELTFTGQRRARMREVFVAPDMSDDDADAAVAEFLATFERSWRLFPDVIPTLDALRGTPLAVVTNGHEEQQLAKLERMGIRDRFAVIVASDTSGSAKPERRIFEVAWEALGVAPSACVFVGNDWTCDVVGPRDAGLTPIWLRRDGGRVDEVHCITSLAELLGHPAVKSR